MACVHPSRQGRSRCNVAERVGFVPDVSRQINDLGRIGSRRNPPNPLETSVSGTKQAQFRVSDPAGLHRPRGLSRSEERGEPNEPNQSGSRESPTCECRHVNERCLPRRHVEAAGSQPAQSHREAQCAAGKGSPGTGRVEVRRIATSLDLRAQALDSRAPRFLTPLLIRATTTPAAVSPLQVTG